MTYAVAGDRHHRAVALVAGIARLGLQPDHHASRGPVSRRRKGSLLVGASLLVYLMPILAIACIGLLLSTVFRNSAAAIVGTLMFSLLLQLIGILPGLGGLQPYLLSTQFNAWQGLLRTPVDWDADRARRCGSARSTRCPALGRRPHSSSCAATSPEARHIGAVLSSRVHLRGTISVSDMRVLIVEDESKMAGLIRRGLRQEGMAADLAGKGEDALWMAGTYDYDAIVLDLMLPGIDGLTVCRRLREAGKQTPILMISARDMVEDRVRGLDAGADDYLVKPFALEELAARLRALARRRNGQRSPELRVGDLRLDPAKRQVWRGRGGGRALGQGVRRARGLHAAAWRGAYTVPVARARLGLRVREPLQHR